MKRIISTVLLTVYIFVSLNINSISFAADEPITTNKQVQLDEFSEDLVAMIEENSDLYENAVESESEETVAVYEENEYTYNDFATCRLIVRSYKSYENSYGADEAVTGYEDLQVIQYESVEETINAFNSLSSKSDVISVLPDTEIDLSTEESSEATKEYNWAYDRVRVYEAIEYVTQKYNIDELPEIKIGILDSGVWTEETNIKERIIGEYSLITDSNLTIKVTQNHANRIARVIADCTTTNVKIYSYQGCDINGNLYVSNVIVCEERMLLDDLDIVNFSFGSNINYNIGSKLDKQGTLIISSAGNEGSNQPNYPAAAEYTISVAAMNTYDKLSSFSSRGYQYVDVVAPGENLPGVGSGTSFSCPMVVSLCAMIMSLNPEYTREQVVQKLYSSCDSTLLAGNKTKYGTIDFMNALAGSKYKDALAYTPSFNLTSRPTPTTMYSEIQYLELYCNEGEEIYYTTDTSYPTRQTATLYTEPIELDVTTKIRAVTFSKKQYRSEPADLTVYIQVYGDIPDNDNGWTINSKGYVTGYYGYEISPTIPDKIFDTTVTGIAERTFEKMTFIEKITLPETCTYIDSYAFKGCKYLDTISAPGVTTVKIESFMDCVALDDINMPKLKKLSRGCFRNCGELNNLPVDNFTLIPQYAFAYCTFSYISFPNVTEIYSYAFNGCYNLIEISIPSLIDGCLGESVFSNCNLLEKVNFPEDFVSLAGFTFSGCNMSNFDFLQNIQYVYWGDFNWCQYVEVMSLPSVVLVDTRTFDYMPSLKEVIIPSCTTVLEQAFRSNRYLEKIVFSDNLEFVGANLFVDCPMMKYVVLNGLVNSTEAVFEGTSIERVEFNKIQTLASLPEVKNSIVALPSTFESCSEDTTGREYKVFGTKGSTAETWAEANGHTFYEISQENSIVTDIATVYDENSIEPLTFDAIGINSSYQWYGSLDNKVDNSDDVAIKGATTNEFTPKKGDKYPYYYCKMISTDTDTTGKSVSVEIFSSICQNKLCYMTAKDNTDIDYVNKRIFTTQFVQQDFSNIVGTQKTITVDGIASFANPSCKFYGTGSMFIVYENSAISEIYTLIVQGDINGDSAVDVLDAYSVSLTVNGHKDLTGNEFLAADINQDEELTIVDYQQVVNFALSG